MYRILIFLTLAGLLASCHSPSEPGSVGNFPPEVSTIFQNNCLGGGCHSGASSTNDQLDLSSWEALVKSGDDINEIIPFTAVKSHLFGHINTNESIGAVITPTMPYPNPLSPSDQLAIFNWINGGAKSADGQIPYSSIAKKIFVPNQNDNMISVIDAETQRWARIVSTGDKSLPTALAMMPDNSTLLAAMNGANGVIKKYDATTYGSLGQFQSNLNPAAIALVPNGSKGYITDDRQPGNDFGVFDPISMTMKKIISTPLLIQAFDATVSPDGKYAYICGVGSDNIIRVDTKNDSIVSCLPLGADVPVPPTTNYSRKYTPRKLLISSDSKMMYVSCLNTSEVVVFDLTKDSITARIPLKWNPWGLALTPDGSELWATTWGSNQVHVISTTTNQVLAEIDSVSLLPHAITITPGGAYAYVACELAEGGQHHHETGGEPPSSYVVIDCKTRKVISIQELPALSLGITIGYK